MEVARLVKLVRQEQCDGPKSEGWCSWSGILVDVDSHNRSITLAQKIITTRNSGLG